MAENKDTHTQGTPEGKATHSGWNYAHLLFSKYRDEALKLGQVVLGANQINSIKFLKQYHSSLYSMAQQIFSFYDPETEKKLTEEWIGLGDKINNTIHFVSDKDFRNQLGSEGKPFISKELKVEIMMYFNKINRMADKAGFLIGKEDIGKTEPKKGLIGLK